MKGSGPCALVATLGTSPGVVTRLLDYLLFTEKLPLREVVVVHTGGPPVHAGIQKILESFPGSRLGEIDGLREVPDALYRAGEGREARFNLVFHGLVQVDLLAPEDNKAVFAALARHVWRLRRAGNRVLVGLAGGRKQQSAYALLSAMLFGADRALHLVSAEGFDTPDKNELPHVDPRLYRVVDVPFPALTEVHASLAAGGPPDDDHEMIALIDRLCEGIPAIVQAGLASLDLLPVEGPCVRVRSAAMREAIQTARGRRVTLSPVYLFGPVGSGRGTVAELLAAEQGGKERVLVLEGSAMGIEDLFGKTRGLENDGDLECWVPSPLEAFDRGALVIKNLDHMPIGLQAQILHLFERLPAVRLPGTGPEAREIRLWLIVTASLDLPDAIQAETLLAGWREVLRCPHGIRIPSLWERREDLPEIVPTALKYICESAGISVRPPPPELIRALEAFDFSGLEVADLVNALRTWMGKEPGDWDSVLRELETARRSPAWASQETRERKVLAEWFEIRRRPAHAAELAASDRKLLEEVVRYALMRFSSHPEDFAGIRSKKAFLDRFFPNVPDGVPRRPSAPGAGAAGGRSGRRRRRGPRNHRRGRR